MNGLVHTIQLDQLKRPTIQAPPPLTSKTFTLKEPPKSLATVSVSSGNAETTAIYGFTKYSMG